MVNGMQYQGCIGGGAWGLWLYMDAVGAPITGHMVGKQVCVRWDHGCGWEMPVFKIVPDTLRGKVLQ